METAPPDHSETLHINAEFERAFEMLERSSQNIFLTGRAGTGKSTFLDYFRKHTKKQIAVVAPTGVAALNVGGQTIHSFFKLPPKYIDLQDPSIIQKSRSRLYQKLEVLVIDEISMVRADIFQGIDAFLRLNGPKKGEPFGGVQLCVIGDLYQLPPIVRRDEQAFFNTRHATPFFFSTESFAQANFTRIEFREIFRQADNRFIELLNRIRQGDTGAEVLAAINARVAPLESLPPGALTLTTLNSTADSINEARLAALPGIEYRFQGALEGNFGLSGDRLPAPELLRLKMGAQVMFTRNDHRQKRWVNGTLGTVCGLNSEEISVDIGSRRVRLETEQWDMLRYAFDPAMGKVVEQSVGSYTQFPLMPAWAVTIHKAQGKTLDRVVIDLGNGAFAPGQLYVALSRCRALERIALRKPATAADIRCDTRVLEFG